MFRIVAFLLILLALNLSLSKGVRNRTGVRS